MAIDTAQKRMSAICPASPWRGPLVDATESGFGVGNRGAAAFLYSGLFAESGSAAAIGYFPHRFFAIRHFPDRYFPGTGASAVAFGQPLEWQSFRRSHDWGTSEREAGWASNRRRHEWGAPL